MLDGARAGFGLVAAVFFFGFAFVAAFFFLVAAGFLLLAVAFFFVEAGFFLGAFAATFFFAAFFFGFAMLRSALFYALRSAADLWSQRTQPGSLHREARLTRARHVVGPVRVRRPRNLLFRSDGLP
ncbi:MAG: hypothetical protein VW999_04575 [Alphaproteobacteria bacterium]